MKRAIKAVLLTVLCAVFLFGILPQSARAEEIDNYVYTIKDSEVTIKDYVGTEKDLVIPDTIEGYPVKYIAMRAFSGLTELESVVIPDSVVDIGLLGFDSCPSLKSVQLSKNLPDISACVFMNCPSLESIVIPEGVTAIYSGAFMGCEALRTAVIPASVTVIDEGIFYKCTALEHVLFTGSEEQWNAIEINVNEGEANNMNANLLSVSKHFNAEGDEIRYVDEKTCTEHILVKCDLCSWRIVDPDFVGSHTYGDDGFCTGCGACSFFGYTIGADGVTITDYTGSHTVLSIPAQIEGKPVAAIGDRVFYGNSTIKELVIPESIKSIGTEAFAVCTALTDVEFLGAAPEGGKNAFAWGSATILYPADAGWTEEVRASYGGDVKWKCSATSGSCGDALTWSFSKDGVLTISGTGAMHDYNATDESQVTDVPWSVWAQDITSIVIEDGVTKPGTYAFAYCGNVKKITLPEQLTALPDWVFADCYSLEEINIPAGLKSIGDNAFYHCTALQNVTLPEGLVSIGENAFMWSAVQKVNIPGTVKEIGAWAFSGCRSITEVTIGEGVTVLPQGMFSEASGITSLSLPDTLTKISGEAFMFCSGLTEINIPAGVTAVEAYTFAECTGLTEITISANIKKIEEYAFSGCTGVSVISFLGDAPDIKAHAFEDMGNVLAFYPAENSTWDTNSKLYYGAKSVLWVSEVLAQGRYGTDIRWVLQKDGSLLITGSGDMPDFGFGDTPAWSEYADQIKTIEISPFITRIGNYSFKGLKNLTKVTTKDTLKAIGEYAFTECSSLTDVTIGDTVMDIEEGAFSWCESLEEIKLPMFLQNIGRFAFNGCKFKSLTIPGLVQTIGADPFNYSLNSIAFEGNPPSFDPETFASFFDKRITAYYDSGNTFWTSSVKQNYGGIVSWAGGKTASGKVGSGVNWKLGYDRTLTLSGSGAVPSYSTSGYAPWASYSSYITNIVVEDGITYLGDYAFYKLGSLRSVTLADSVREIGVSTFSECTYLTEFTMGKALYLINDKAFYRCESLETINWSESVEAIGASAFKECTSLTELKLPESLTAIYENAFTSCEGLTSVEFPKALEEIGSYAFSYCEDLAEIRFAGDQPDIGNSAFYYVSAKAYYPAKNTTWPYYMSGSYGGTLTWISDCMGDHSFGAWYEYEDGLERRDCSDCTEYETRKITIPKVTISGVESSGKIKISWKKIDGASKYYIYRATSKSGKYSAIAETTKTSYTDKTAKAGKVYYYKVKAIHSNSSANSAYSSVVSQTCKLASPVVKESNVSSSGKIKLEWKKIDGAKSYTIYRATSKTGSYMKLTTTTSASYTDKSAKAGKVYYYKVKANHSNSSANSAYSSVVSQTCKLERPDVSVKLSSGKPKLTWDEVSGAKEYTVYRATSKDGKYTALKTTTSEKYTDKSAKKGKTYYYKVKAVHKNSSANSAYSSVDSIKATK